MALNNLQCNHLMPLHFKGLNWCSNIETVIWCGLLWQNPSQLVISDATLHQRPCQQASNTTHSPDIIYTSYNTSQWGSSHPVTTAVCLNTDTAPIYNRQHIEAATNSHQMALRRPSNSAVIHDPVHRNVYNPELDATENPEYFHTNGLLFALHQLSSERHGRSFFELWVTVSTFVRLLSVILAFNSTPQLCFPPELFVNVVRRPVLF